MPKNQVFGQAGGWKYVLLHKNPSVYKQNLLIFEKIFTLFVVMLTFMVVRVRMFKIKIFRKN